eukprot:6299933-Ditylum_brightwellii.AAC.1
MRGHTGSMVSLGQRSVFSSSTKQTLNAKSSTKMELIAVNDARPHIIWTTYFLECQGYNVGKAQIFQDNMSAMLLKNGKWSSGKNTRHINMRYFFIKDKIDSGELEVKHCGAEDMLADYFTKPLQGHLFRKFRKAIAQSVI